VVHADDVPARVATELVVGAHAILATTVIAARLSTNFTASPFVAKPGHAVALAFATAIA